VRTTAVTEAVFFEEGIVPPPTIKTGTEYN
jgi:hypothetical protein